MPNRFNKDDMDKIINNAQEAGISKSDIEAAQSGNLNNLMNKLKPDDAQKLQEVLKNKALQQKILNSPQAQALLKKLSDKK